MFRIRALPSLLVAFVVWRNIVNGFRGMAVMLTWFNLSLDYTVRSFPTSLMHFNVSTTFVRHIHNSECCDQKQFCSSNDGNLSTCKSQHPSGLSVMDCVFLNHTSPIIQPIYCLYNLLSHYFANGTASSLIGHDDFPNLTIK